MNGFERRREAKKAKILQAAIELFSEQGVKEASIAEIARKANVSQVSIYNFFESKDNLARLAFITYMDKKMNQTEKLAAADISFPEKFRQLLLDVNEAGQNLSEEFFQSIVWQDPEIQSYYEEYYQSRTIPLLMNLINQGKKEAYVDAALSAEAILIYIGMFKNALNQPGLDKNTRLDLGKLFFFGILGKPGISGEKEKGKLRGR